VIGSGVDFDSSQITVRFKGEEVSKRVNIPVSCDEEVEEDEIFDIILSLTTKNPQVGTGGRSVGRITDSTGQ